MATFAEWTENKKKKKKSATGSTFTDYTKSVLGRDDIEAPIGQTSQKQTTNDIAPVKEEKERSWFQKGAFEDGYQFGDVFKTLSATGQDLHSNVMAGLLGIVENTVDAGAYVTGAVGGLFSEDFKEDTKEFIAKDIINEKAIAEKIVGIQHPENLLVDTDNDRDSLLGEKTEGVAQSGGQLLGTLALQSVGVPWFVTSGVTSFGGEVENAFNQGADYIEAGISGVVTAGAEILTEKISGGINFGAGTLDDVLTKKLATEISNKAVRTMAKFGMDILGEGSEEIISQFVSNLGSSLYREENLKDILFSEEAVDEYIESFIGGAMLGGVSSGASTVDSIVHKKDATTGLTANEEKVFKKVYEDRIAEAEEGGKKLTNKEKNQIYDEVMEDLERGGISTEAIEEALGVESYKTYKKTVDSEEALKKELEELRKMKSGDMNDIQTERLAELKGMNLTDTRTRETLFKQYEEEISGLVKDSKLAESYNERARRGQVFEADLSKYDEKQKAVVQKAIDSGILNNTRRTHEFVDMVAKLSADKGVLFDFTNNENLKNSGFAVDGKFVNGYYDSKNKSIGLNIDSKKALNTVVGHEITHVLEGTELYGELQKAAFEYAKTKKDYDGRRKALESLYDAKDIDSELTADLVGEYLFDDTDFIKGLSVNNRNVFQKIYDEIKYLCKIATAGSKEKRQLETVKRAFEKAYKEGGKTAEKSGDTQYSLDMVDAVKPTSNKWAQGATTDEVRAKHPTLYAVDETATEKRNPTQVKGTVGSYRNIYNILKQEGFNGTILDAFSGLGYGTKAGIEEYGFDVEDIEPYPDSAYNPKYTDYSTLDKTYDVVISNAVLNVLPQDQRDALTVKMGELLNPGGRMFVNVRGKDVLNASGKIAINESNMEYFIPRTAKTGSYQKGFTQSELVAYLEDALGDGFTVKPTKEFGAVSAIVTKDSVQYSLTAEQQEYFKDSKIRDKDGNLIKLYHGTMADFTEFDISKSGENYNGWSEYGEGVYLTPDRKMAQYYADNVGLGRDTKLMELYANVSNPFNTMEPVDFDISDLVQKYELTEFDESFIKKAGYRLVDFLKTHKENVRTYLTEKGYDGVWDMGYNGEVDQVVVYDSNQVKNIDNTKPTENPDIRYSLSDSDGKKLTKKQQEYFKDSKMRDDNGNLKVMYHGTQDAGFHTFESRFSDDDTSFFFVDRNDMATTYSGSEEVYEARTMNTAEDMNKFLAEIGYDHYSVVEKNGKLELLENNEHVATKDTAQEIYEEFCWYEGVGEGDANYKVYLNLKNPLEIDAKGRPWNKIDAEYSQEVYDKYKTLTEEEKAALHDLAGWEDFSLFNSEIQTAKGNELASAYEKLGDYVNKYDLFSIATENFSEESLKEYSLRYLKTRDFAQRAKEQGYDGVIFKNILDGGPYSNGSEEAATVAVAFESNQIKSVANENPTGNPDIRYSLSTDSEGRKLSEEQKSYFKDSKAVDENGNLKVVYHGTRNADFTVFKRNINFFTDSREMADSYAPTGELYEGYVNIAKPYEIDAKGEKWSKIPVDSSTKEFLQNYGASVFKEGGKWRTTPADLASAIEEAIESGEVDYDGIIIKNIDDTGSYYKGEEKHIGTDYIVFNGNQFKNANNQNPTSNPDIRYSLTEYTAEEKKAHNDAVLKHFGKTYKWAETGYLLLDGTRLDLSGKHDGAPGGYRTVDHRDITEALGYDYGGGDYSGSLIQFMSEGNIRIIPESNGINLSVKPTKAQEQALSDFISRYRGEVMLDIDDSNGYTVVSVEYPYGTYYTRVLNDIREWFDNGKKPEVSGAYPFRSLSAANEQQKRSRNGIYGEDIRFDAPIKATDTTETAPEEVAPVSTPITESEADEIRDESFASLDDTDAPIEREPFMADYERQAVTINNDSLKQITDKVSNILSLDKNDTARLSETIQKYAENPDMTGVDLVNELRQDFKYTEEIENYDDRLEDAKRHMKGTHIYVPENLKGDFDGKSKDGFNAFRKEHFGHFYLTTNENAKAIGIDQAYQELRELFPEHFPEDIWNPADQLQRMGEVASSTSSTFESMDYDDATLQEVSEIINSGINQYSQDEASRIAEEARNDYFNASDDFAPVKDKAYEAIRPKKEAKKSNEPKLIRVKDENARPGEKQRKWVDTSTDSEAVGRKILPEDLNQDTIHYQPISNKKTLGNANAKLNGMGYESSVAYFNSQFANKSVSLDDVALGERLIQEAIKRGDTKTAGELIQNVAILGTELGQKVQALSIIKRLTPEGQLGMLQKTVERGKTKGDKAYEGVEFTQDMIDHILKTYGKDGTYDQKELNKAVEDVKQKIADQMKVTKTDKVNAWRYLSMLGNPKTHIRNFFSNVAMRGTVAAKNVVARTIETIGPVKERTKTWERATDDVKKFAQTTTMEMKDEIMDGGKYSEDASIKAKRTVFKNKILNGIYEFNSDLLTKEDWWFSKSAYSNSLSEYLTANGIRTAEDIQKHPETVEKAKQYAMEQAQIATFRQYSWLANKINEIERKNTATGVAVGAVLPFKKTPINIAKAALNYSPLGFVKTLTYDASQVKKGEMEASKMIDNLAQNLTGSALTLAGYMLAQAGFLNGGGEDDKEGDYDYQLGEQAYSVNIGDATFSLSWLSPIAMPLFVGANAYEQLVEGKEWNGDVVIETLAQTLDPLSEMSFLSSLDDVLSSYDSGVEKFAGIGQSMAQNYITQFAPTLMSQVAQVMDDTKRSTKVAADSEFKFVDETINKLKYKIPFLRETLEPSTDIWGNEVKQTEDIFTRAVETFIAPYAKRDNIATEIDEEIKDLYRQTGDTGLIPSIPYNYINYDGSKYEMSAKDFTDYKKAYGQTAYDLMEKLFDTDTYRNATSEERADMVNKVYDYARDEAKRGYFTKYGVDFTNAEKEGVEYYKENSIKGAIENDMTPDEYEFSTENPEKYDFLNSNGVSYDDFKNGSEEFKDAYTWAFKNPEKFTLSKAVASDVVTYRKYASELYDIKADKDENGKSISGSRKEKVADYINNLDIDYGEKIILFKNEYNADDRYNREIIDYLNSREDISFEEMRTILIELGFRVDSKGHITWD